MAKTKRMFMGGAAKAAMQSVKSAPKTGPAGMQGLGQAMSGKPGMPPPAGSGQMQFLSDKIRNSPPSAVYSGSTLGAGTQGLGQAMSGKPGMPPPAGSGQMQFMSDRLRGNPGMPPPAGPVKMQGLGQAMGGNPQMAQNLGRVAGAAMGGMGMKNGGTASSRADGCATKGKTKGKFV